MKTLFSLKNFITLSLVALGLSLIPTASQANIFGPGAEIVILTTGDQVTFNHTVISLSNWDQQNGMFGLPQRNIDISKGDDITLHNTTDGLVSLKFSRELNGNVRVDFPLGILSKRNPDDGCDGGLIASGCGAPDPGEVYGVGFPHNLQERIFSEVPAYFTGEGIKILFRATENDDFVPWDDDNKHSPLMLQNTLVKIRVQDYPTPQVPGGNQNFGSNEKLTQLDQDDYLKINLAFNKDDPKNKNLLDEDDQQITVTYLEGTEEKTETFDLRGDLDLRFFGPESNFVRAKASVGFPDAFEIQAESTASAFTKLEYWTRGENAELKGTFNKGPVTKVLFFAYSGAFSYVKVHPAQNPGEFGTAMAVKIESGDKLTLLQAGNYLNIRTKAPEVKLDPINGKLAFNPNGGGGSDDGENVPGFDPQKDPDVSIDDLNIIGSTPAGAAPAFGGGACSLSTAAAAFSWWHLFGIFGLALPMAAQGIRRK